MADNMALARAWAREVLDAEVRGTEERRRMIYYVLRFVTEWEYEPRWSMPPVADITPEDVAHFFGVSLGRGAHNRGAYREAVTSFFNWALAKGMIAENPMDSPLVQVILTAPTRRRRPSSGVGSGAIVEPSLG